MELYSRHHGSFILIVFLALPEHLPQGEKVFVQNPDRYEDVTIVFHSSSVFTDRTRKVIVLHGFAKVFFPFAGNIKSKIWKSNPPQLVVSFFSSEPLI